MKSNTPTTAPVLAEYHQVFAKWEQNHLGGSAAFFRFMTTPSVEREIFLAGFRSDVVFTSGVAILKILEDDED